MAGIDWESLTSSRIGQILPVWAYKHRQGPILVLLLCGGNKADQSRDIEHVIEYLKDWKERGKP